MTALSLPTGGGGPAGPSAYEIAQIERAKLGLPRQTQLEWLESIRAAAEPWTFDPAHLDWEADYLFPVRAGVRHLGSLWVALQPTEGTEPGTNDAVWQRLVPGINEALYEDLLGQVEAVKGEAVADAAAQVALASTARDGAEAAAAAAEQTLAASVRWDHEQGLTTPQKAQARGNLGLSDAAIAEVAHGAPYTNNLLIRLADVSIPAFSQREHLVIKNVGHTGLSVITPNGRAGLDLIGDDGVVTSGNLHFWDATYLSRSQKLAFNNSLHGAAPNAAYMRNSPDNGAHNHESMRWFFDYSTTDNDDGNCATQGNFGIGVSYDLWAATAADHVLTFAPGTAPTALANYVHTYNLGGELRTMNGIGDTAQLSGSPRWLKNGSQGPQLDLAQYTGAPAPTMIPGNVRFRSRNSADAEISYAELRGVITDPTAATAAGRFEMWTTIAGTLALRATMGAGLYMTGATGGDLGAGSINATLMQAPVIRLPNGATPTNLPGYGYLYALSGQVRALSETGSGAQLTEDPRWTKVSEGTQGPQLDLAHATTTPAVSDLVSNVRNRSRNSVNSELSYSEIRTYITDPTSAAEIGRLEFWTTQSGANASRASLGAGLCMAGATGGDKGAGTINATAVYDDNVALTCMAMADEFIERGEVDLDKWDAMVPDLVVPDTIETQAVMKTVEITVVSIETNTAGDFVRREKVITKHEPDTALHPVYDDEGNGVDAIEKQIFEEVRIPGGVVKRQHRTARIFKAMIDAGFDPRDPEQYFARMRLDEALPGMPTQADWMPQSLGDLACRKWLAMEMLAIVCNVMWARLKDHEARLGKLESKARR